MLLRNQRSLRSKRGGLKEINLRTEANGGSAGHIPPVLQNALRAAAPLALGIDSSVQMFSLCSMAVETLGEAWSAGWGITIRCAWGKREAMKSVRECTYRKALDLETLVCTRGRDFPLTHLESRLRCPRCGSRRVAVLFDVPKHSNVAR